MSTLHLLLQSFRQLSLPLMFRPPAPIWFRFDPAHCRLLLLFPSACLLTPSRLTVWFTQELFSHSLPCPSFVPAAFRVLLAHSTLSLLPFPVAFRTPSWRCPAQPRALPQLSVCPAAASCAPQSPSAQHQPSLTSQVTPFPIHASGQHGLCDWWRKRKMCRSVPMLGYG